MVVRTSKEFGFKIATFHHASSAWKIPEILAENNITVALFDDWGFKMEAYEGSVYAPKILYENGVKVAIKSDHPVTNAQYLLSIAQSFSTFGLTEFEALATVTSTPADAMGLGDRIGRIEVGYDADIVVWDRNPMEIGAVPGIIFIDGEQALGSLDFKPLRTDLTPATGELTYSGGTACSGEATSEYVVCGNTIHLVDDQNSVLTDSCLVVENNLVTCIGQCTLPPDVDVYNLGNGSVITPGLVNIGSPVGLQEIIQEANAQDGTASFDFVMASTVKMIDGLRFNFYENRVMRASWAGGVTNLISAPQGTMLVKGLGGAYHSYGKMADQSTVLSDATALHLQIGNDAKGSVSSISGQIAQLRFLFQQAKNEAPSNSSSYRNFISVLNNEIPCVVEVDQADEIVALVSLKKEFGFSLIIVGGKESHLIADFLSQNNVSVVLFSEFSSRESSKRHGFESWHTLKETASILQSAGVNVALGVGYGPLVRILRWEAGLAVSNGLGYDDALASITRTPANMFGLGDQIGTIQIGSPANLVGWSGEPLGFQSIPLLLALKDYVECHPKNI